MRTILPEAVDSLSSFLKISLAGFVDVDKFLRVAIDKREPCALNLNHDAMSFFEGVRNARHRVFDFRDLVRFERLGFLE